MKAPSLEDTKGYCEIIDSSKKFEVQYDGIKEWFEGEFEHIEENENGNKDLKRAFYMHVDHQFSKKVGILKEKDLDATIEYSSNSLPEEIQEIYDRYKSEDQITEDIEEIPMPMVF